MCGIYGILVPRQKNLSVEETTHYNETIRKLSIANTSRGEDAVGLFKVDRKGKISYYKRAIPMWNAFYDPGWNKMVNIDNDLTGIVCHVRERSVKTWNNDDKNAHPHITSSLIGVHNGTIDNFIEFYPNEESDSLSLFKFIEEKGLEHLDKLSGAMAVVYVNYNENPKIFNFISYKRPLHFAHENGLLIFSSDDTHLRSILTGKSKIFSLEEGRLLKVNTNKGLKKSVVKIVVPSCLSSREKVYAYEHYSSTPTVSYRKCDICNSCCYTVVTIRNVHNVKVKEHCLTCKPDACTHCGFKMKYDYYSNKEKVDNNLWAVNARDFLCRDCYLDYMTTALIEKSPDKLCRCVLCKAKLPINCMEYFFVKGKLHKRCATCSFKLKTKEEALYEEIHQLG